MARNILKLIQPGNLLASTATYHLARLLGASAGGSLATSLVASAIGAAAPVVLK